jgi:hypothetical protein
MTENEPTSTDDTEETDLFELAARSAAVRKRRAQTKQDRKDLVEAALAGVVTSFDDLRPTEEVALARMLQVMVPLLVGKNADSPDPEAMRGVAAVIRGAGLGLSEREITGALTARRPLALGSPSSTAQPADLATGQLDASDLTRVANALLPGIDGAGRVAFMHLVQGLQNGTYSVFETQTGVRVRRDTTPTDRPPAGDRSPRRPVDTTSTPTNPAPESTATGRASGQTEPANPAPVTPIPRRQPASAPVSPGAASVTQTWPQAQEPEPAGPYAPQPGVYGSPATGTVRRPRRDV